MSTSSVKVSPEFAKDFADAARYLSLTGETDKGIEDIRQRIRAAFKAGEDIEEWTQWVKNTADAQRELDAMSRGINERMREHRNAA